MRRTRGAQIRWVEEQLWRETVQRLPTPPNERYVAVLLSELQRLRCQVTLLLLARIVGDCLRSMPAALRGRRSHPEV